jgi:hypothetical protein
VNMAHFRQHYFDGRTSEGRRLRAVMKGITTELGGEAALTAAQRLILDQLREKIASVHALSAHIGKQAALIGEDGELIPALRRSYLAYSNSVRRDVEVLFQLREKPTKGKKVPDLASYLQGGKA